MVHLKEFQCDDKLLLSIVDKEDDNPKSGSLLPNLLLFQDAKKQLGTWYRAIVLSFQVLYPSGKEHGRWFNSAEHIS